MFLKMTFTIHGVSEMCIISMLLIVIHTPLGFLTSDIFHRRSFKAGLHQQVWHVFNVTLFNEHTGSRGRDAALHIRPAPMREALFRVYTTQNKVNLLVCFYSILLQSQSLILSYTVVW